MAHLGDDYGANLCPLDNLPPGFRGAKGGKEEEVKFLCVCDSGVE